MTETDAVALAERENAKGRAGVRYVVAFTYPPKSGISPWFVRRELVRS